MKCLSADLYPTEKTGSFAGGRRARPRQRLPPSNGATRGCRRPSFLCSGSSHAPLACSALSGDVATRPAAVGCSWRQPAAAAPSATTRPTRVFKAPVRRECPMCCCMCLDARMQRATETLQDAERQPFPMSTCSFRTSTRGRTRKSASAGMIGRGPTCAPASADQGPARGSGTVENA